MANLSCFASAELEAACKVLGDTANGLSGSEIGQLLLEIGVADTAPSMTKWKRLYNALAEKQNQIQAGNFLIQFINKAMAPAKYVSAPELFHWRRDGLNVALAFAGYRVRDDGKGSAAGNFGMDRHRNADCSMIFRSRNARGELGDVGV